MLLASSLSDTEKYGICYDPIVIDDTKAGAKDKSMAKHLSYRRQKLFIVANFCNKLECLLLASLSNLVHCLLERPGAYPRVEHIKVTSFGWVPALPTNIGQGGKSFPGTSTPAYYRHL
jgi:hypothetical protein